MTHQIYLEDGTTTIDLHQGFYRIGQFWRPASAAQNPQAVSEQSEDAYLDVIENIPIVIVEGDAIGVASRVRDLQRMLSKARHWATSSDGDRVWLRVELDGYAGQQYKAEVLGGSVEVDIGTLHNWSDSSPVAEATISLTRKGVWRAVTPTDHLLTSYIDTNSLTARVLNAGAECYVTLYSGSVVPTPAKITIRNTDATTWTGEVEVYIGHNAYNNPSQWDHHLSSSELDSGVNVQTWSSAVGFDTLQYAWNLSATQLSYAKGDDFRFIAGVDIPVGAYIRGGIYHLNGSSYDLLLAGDPVLNEKPNHQLHDLGAFPLPPGGRNSAGYNLAVGISVRHASAGSANLFGAQLWPTASFQHLIKLDSYDVPVNVAIIDNGIEGVSYAGGEASRRPVVVSKLDHVSLVGGFGPSGQEQRIYIAAVDGTGAILGNEITVQVQSETRLLTL